MPCCCLLTFSKSLFKKKILSGTLPEGSKGLDLDQNRCFVIPDLGPNCLQDYQRQQVTSRKEIQ